MGRKGLNPQGRIGKVGYAGGCWIVRMTEEIRDGLHLKLGDPVNVKVKDGKIIIERVE